MIDPVLKPAAIGNKSGDLLARITSPKPTRYRLARDGGSAFIHVFCALDTIEYALIAGENLSVVGDSPAGSVMLFTLTSTGPEPAAGWMSTVIPGHISQLPSVKGMPSRCCPYIHFFASKEMYIAWNKTLSDGIKSHIECISLSEAWRRARRELAVCQTPLSCEYQ